MDHVIPYSRRGLDNWYNLVPACNYCNLRKNDKTPVEWMMQKEFQMHYPNSPGKRRSKTLREAYEAADKDIQDFLDRLDQIQAEITDKARSDWFFDRWWYSRYPIYTCWMAGDAKRARDRIIEAQIEGWPPLPPPKPRKTKIVRNEAGFLTMVEIKDEDE
ncbi:HNH endonuclease [Streptomyces atratus]|uniref:HNH endonuclease n=1 Tax=Streptomyces atratus TaxID=1893 RepID=UPI0036B613CB